MAVMTSKDLDHNTYFMHAFENYQEKSYILSDILSTNVKIRYNKNYYKHLIDQNFYKLRKLLENSNAKLKSCKSNHQNRSDQQNIRSDNRMPNGSNKGSIFLKNTEANSLKKDNKTAMSIEENVQSPLQHSLENYPKVLDTTTIKLQYKKYYKHLIDQNFYKLRKVTRNSTTMCPKTKLYCNQMQMIYSNHNLSSRNSKIFSITCLNSKTSDNYLDQCSFSNETSSNSNSTTSPRISETLESDKLKDKLSTDASNSDCFRDANISIFKSPKVAKKDIKRTSAMDEEQEQEQELEQEQVNGVISSADFKTEIDQCCSDKRSQFKNEFEISENLSITCLNNNTSNNCFDQCNFSNETSNNSNSTTSPRISETLQSDKLEDKLSTDASNSDCFSDANISISKLPKVVKEDMKRTHVMDEEQEQVNDAISPADFKTKIDQCYSDKKPQFKNEFGISENVPSCNSCMSKENISHTPTSRLNQRAKRQVKLFANLKADDVDRVSDILDRRYRSQNLLSSFNGNNGENDLSKRHKDEQKGRSHKMEFNLHSKVVDLVNRVYHVLGPRFKPDLLS